MPNIIRDQNLDFIAHYGNLYSSIYKQYAFETIRPFRGLYKCSFCSQEIFSKSPFSELADHFKPHYDRLKKLMVFS